MVTGRVRAFVSLVSGSLRLAGQREPTVVVLCSAGPFPPVCFSTQT